LILFVTLQKAIYDALCNILREQKMDDHLLKERLNELKQSPYIKLPFIYDHNFIAGAVDSFFNFLDLPQEIKNFIDLKVSPRHRRGELGFRHRHSADDIYSDDKEFFHFHPLIFQNYGEFIEQNQVVSDFLVKANKIWLAVDELIDQIMRIYDQTFPGCKAKIFNQDPSHIVLRFLKYSWKNSSEYLAKPHFDSGSLTLALAESSPGLRIGSGPDDLQIITHEDKQALFFFSSNYKKIINSDEFLPAWHDVVQTDDNQIGKPCSRWAVVAFIDGNNVESLPRSETHKYSK